MSNDVAVLVLSCDSYADLWLPFFTLLHKYWNCPYNIYISTETKECEYAIAINKNEKSWTQRIMKTLQEIPNKYVIIMCEDFFFRDYVKQDRIDYCINHFEDDTATFNFEKSYSLNDLQTDLEGFKLRPKNAFYKLSCQAGIWDKDKLIELLNCNLTAWQWENIITNSTYKFYINDADFVFNYGYENHQWFGIRKGKWIKETIEHLKKEGLEIDIGRRGIYETVNNSNLS